MSTRLSDAFNEIHARMLDTIDERLQESERFHMGIGEVHKTLERIAQDLEEEGIDYAIVGGMALNAHGYKKETIDVDILLTPAGLQKFTARFVGRGYRPVFEGARKHFRDTANKVKVEFLTTGEFPGDGKPKPVAFPDPAEVAVIRNGKKYISLPGLITLKLASGMTNPDRMKDLADVQELIRELRLSERIAEELHPYVRDRFLDLFRVTRQNPPEE